MTGRLRRKRGNDPFKYKPCRPNTMGMPTEETEASSTDFDGCEWTETHSKTTASKSWKTGEEDSKESSQVNQTVSLSCSSGEASSQNISRSDDNESTLITRSVNAQSATTRSLYDGNSTLYTAEGNSTLYTAEGNGGRSRRFELDFGSLMGSMMTGDTFSTYTNLRSRGVSWLSGDEGDVESAGVSAILDAQYDDDDDEQESVSWSKHTSCKSGTSSAVYTGTETVTSANTDKYVPSFSETSSSGSHSDDSSASSQSHSSSGSSGSFCTEDGESTSSGSEYWEDVPECGTLVNVKPKLGERVSRVTPDHTSHLLRSRFRKKYATRGAFPFEK